MSQPDQPPTPRPKARAAIRPLDWFVTRALLVVLAVWILHKLYDAKAVRWPLRLLIGGLGIWATFALVRDILWSTKVGGREVRELWEKVCKAVENGPGSVAARLWELLCTAALIAVAGWHLGLVGGSMATSSLREDELGSIHQYSSQGPFTVITEYRLAKNHIFYNVVNAVTPWSDSYHPLRARLWSYVAVGVWFAAVLTWFWRRERYIEGAAVFALGAFNLELLETLLEARGYGFIAAFAGITALFAINYLKNREERWLVLISLLTVLGSWTLPFYIVYAGVVHLGLWLVRRDRATLLSGIFAGLGVLLTYAPVMQDLLKVTDEYDDKYGFRFTGFEAISISLQYFLPETLYRTQFLHAFMALVVLALIPVLARRSARAEARGGWLAFGAVGAFYAFCLKLETPPMRVTSFLAVPLALVAGLWIGMPLWGRWERPLRLFLAPAVAALGVWVGLKLITEYDYMPRQRWRDAGQLIDRLFPAESDVWVNGHYSEMMTCVLDGEDKKLVKRQQEKVAPEINVGAVRRGKWLLFDALFKHSDQPSRINAGQLVEGTRYVTLPLRVNYHRLWFNLPKVDNAQRGVGDLRIGGEPRPLSSATAQEWDPLVLGRTVGLNDALYKEDDYQPDGQLTPEGKTAFETYYSAHPPAPSQALSVDFTVPLRDSDLAGGDKLTPNAQYVGLLLSQSAELKQVRVTWRDVAGRDRELAPSRVRLVGELIIIELPRGPLRAQKIASVNVQVAPEAADTYRRLRNLPIDLPEIVADKVLEVTPRPKLEVLEIWRGAMPLGKD
jgi:hypothetical protein